MMRAMRTTVTLDADVAARLRQLARERGVSFKTAINAALRAGMDADQGPRVAYAEQVRDLGVRPGVDLTKALDLAATLEDEETMRQLELRK